MRTDEALEMGTAAARLGLSATLPEDEIRRARLEALVGPEVYRASVEELAGRYLAAFHLVTICVGLAPEEHRAYEAAMLPRPGRARWEDRLDRILSARPVETVERRAAGSAPAWRARLRCERCAPNFVSMLARDFTGVLDISSSTPFAAVTIRSLTNERGDFIVATFPVADLTQTAPFPMVFPQIADGGGYVTQFIVLGAGGASDLTFNFLGDDGKPLPVGK